MKYVTTSGMSLPELLIALAVFAIVVTPLLTTQGALLQSITKQSHKIEYLWHAAGLLYEYDAIEDTDAKGEIVKKEAATSFSPEYLYQRTPIDKKSSLADIKNLLNVRVSIFPHKNGSTRIKDTIVGIRFRHEEKKKESKGTK